MRITTFALILGLSSIPAVRVPAGAETIEKNKYQRVEVMRFTVAEGIQFPPDYLVAMNEELVTELLKLKKFSHVLHEGEAAPADRADSPGLRLEGVVTSYSAGNRAVRYMVGFGAGKTKIVARVRFIDPATGAVLVEKTVDGKVVLGGVAMSDSAGATRGLAKEVTKLARQKFF